ncbi:MAG: chitinase [Fibrobacteres bacterium]|nr:chitinase [Fibrobacterota bacterium]
MVGIIDRGKSMKHIYATLFFLAALCSLSFGQNKYIGWSLGYFTTWDNTYTPETIPWEAFTHMAYFQVWPNADGSLQLPNEGIAKRLIAEGHKRGKKVIFCVGGAGVKDAFKGACSNANRGKFISNMLAYLKKLGYDGFDTDWEENFDDALFVAWHKDLRDSINKLTPVPLMTIAAEDWFSVTAKVHMYVDQINDMRYTGTSAANYPNSLKVFTNAGADKAKLGVGMGISMGMSVQQVTDMCNLVVAQGYGGVIQWDVTKNGGAPANMAAVAKFINPTVGIFTSGPTKYYDPITLSIDAGNGLGFPQVRYSIPSTSKGANMDLGLYDMSGSLVSTLVHGQAQEGAFSVPLMQRGAAGAYIVRLSAGNASLSSKAILAR